jgi:hypothetical protein
MTMSSDTLLLLLYDWGTSKEVRQFTVTDDDDGVMADRWLSVICRKSVLLHPALGAHWTDPSMATRQTRRPGFHQAVLRVPPGGMCAITENRVS